MRRLLRRGRVKGAEGDIIGTRLPGGHGEMAAVVAGHSDLGGRAEQRPRLPRIAVALAEMDSVGGEPLRQRHVVIDDEGDLVRLADTLERWRESRRLVPVDAFDPELERRDRSA